MNLRLKIRPEAFIPLTGLLLLACAWSCDFGPGSPVDEGFSLRDSSGVTLVVNDSPDQTLAIRETLRFGAIEGDPNLLFDGIRGLAISSDGKVWVCDSHEGVRHYSASGDYLGQVGGRGEGPGEAPSGYGAVWVSSHSILAYGVGAGLQLFSPDGTFLGSRSPFPEPSQILIPLGPTEGGWVFSKNVTTPPTALSSRWTWIIGRGSITSEGFDSLYALAGEPFTRARSGGLSGGSFFDGTPSVAADGFGNVLYSDAFEYRIEVYSFSGRLERVIRRSLPTIPYDGGIRDEVERGVRRSFEILAPGQAGREEVIQSRVDKAMPVSSPTHLPALDLILTSGDGYIWAQRADTHPRPALRAVAAAWGMVRNYWLEEWEAPREFDLFTPEGRYRGSIVLPNEFNPLSVTADRIYGFITDSLDVQYVSAFSVEFET